MTRTVQYELMRPAEILSALATCPVAFVPIGPLEWHGPHLPMGTDALHAHHLAVQAAQRIGGVVLPALFAGTETVVLPGDGAQQLGPLGFEGHERVVGMDFPDNPVKSLYFEEAAFGITVREVVRVLKANPVQIIVLLNGHGAVNHQRTLERLAIEETEPGRVRVVYHPAWTPPAPPQLGPGHADRWETAIMLAIEEQHVALSELPSRAEPLPYKAYGIVDADAFDGRPSPGFAVPEAADPRRAVRAEGTRVVAEELEWLLDRLTGLLAPPQDGTAVRPPPGS